MIEKIEPWVKGKKVLILGFGREGKSTFRLLKKLGICKKIDIADINGTTIKYKTVEVNGNMVIGIPYSCGGITVIPHFNVVALFENNQETENQ